VSMRARRRMVRMHRCARNHRAGRWMQRWRERRAREREERQRAAADWCSPNPHPAGAGCWVIPAWCVMAESGGSWAIMNHQGSGARGPYQLLDKPDPWPVRFRWQAMAHHRIARTLYTALGLRPWTACS
jgi:hypothetical protein